MPPITLPSAGLHYGVSFEDYTAWDAANFSKIKVIRSTASKCKWEMDHPKKPTAAMKLGSALHVATLEPARFETLFHICPPCNRQTTDGKALYAQEEIKASGKLIIRQGSSKDASILGEVENLRGMATAIRSMNAAMKFLDGAGQNEVSALWKDDETGIWCKARFDRFIPDFKGIGPVIVEIKSASNASDWVFGKEVDTRGYAAQAAGYRNGVAVITGKLPLHVFIAVENFAPFDCAVYTLDDADLQTGLLQYRQMLSRYAECLKTNHWPGYPDKVQVLAMPGYAHDRNYET